MGNASRRARTFRSVAGVTVLAAVVFALPAAASDATKPTLAIGGGFGLCTSISPIPRNVNDPMDQLAYEPLIRRKPDGSVVPGLALSWKVGAYQGLHNKVITLTLRRNARFSDGEPVTASAVKTWLDYRATQVGGLTDAYMGPIRSVEVLGKYVVRITLKSPNPIIPRALSDWEDWGTVASPRSVEQAKADPKSPIWSKQTFGAGPYVLVPSQTVLGDHCIYVPNKYFYDQSQIKWGKIIERTINDPNTGLAAIRAGQLDVDLFAGENQAEAAAAAGLEVLEYDTGIRGLELLDRGGRLVPALGDVRVRQALNYAVDKQKIVRALYGRFAHASSLVDVGSDGDDPKYANYYPYNPAKAKALLAAAGYPNGFSFKLLSIGDWIGTPVFDQLGHAIAADLGAVGVKVEVDTPGANDFGPDLGSGTYPAWVTSIAELPAWVYYSFLLAPHAELGDQHGFHDPVIDKLWLRGQRAAPAAAAKIWRQLLDRTETQAYFLQVSGAPVYTFVSKRVGGVNAATYRQSPIDWYPTGK
jgi:peptide/nickel transport system substrate-binding protein